MINSIQQPCNQIPATSASAVNIQIFNPQAYAGAPVNFPVQYRAWNGVPIQQSLYDNSGSSYPQNYNNQSLNLDKKAKRKDVENANLTEQTSGELQIKPLTNEIVKEIENNLNNPDTKTRLIGAKDLLETFKANPKERANNPSLVALLNKTIQDESASVRFIGLTTLDVGYAKGNEETVQILNSMSQNPSEEYAEDKLLAQQILSNTQSGNVK